MKQKLKKFALSALGIFAWIKFLGPSKWYPLAQLTIFFIADMFATKGEVAG